MDVIYSLVILLINVSAYLQVESRPLSNCIVTGLDLVKGKRDIKKIKATFDIKSNLVFYRVMFCEKSHVCFATTMEKTKQNEANNVIKNEKLWSKLMSTIMGHNTLVPYSQTLHEHIYGGQNDHFHCRGNYYIIMGQSRSNTTTEDAKKKRTCLNSNSGSCFRTCSHSIQKSSKCQEIRLNCSFDMCRKSTVKKKNTG